MEQKLVEELLARALQRGVISEKEKCLYLLRYQKGELGLAELQRRISQTPTRKKNRRQIWPYKFIRSLGHGGMGEVFAAYHRDTGQKVAVKKIRFHALQDDEMQEKIRLRFLREGALQAKLHHPNIVKVCDYGAYGDQLFLATELIEGETLQNVVVREKSCGDRCYQEMAPQLLEKMIGICEAIHYAHENNIMHRDINPRNIMLDQARQLRIMDFGLAKKFDIQGTQLTKSNELLGTPSYMSPEQWKNQDVGPWSDVYSLGATLYFIMTGVSPYPENPTTVLYHIANEIPPHAVQHYNKSLPDSFNAMISKAMHHCPAERYPDAQTLATNINQCLQQWKTSPKSFLSKLKNLI